MNPYIPDDADVEIMGLMDDPLINAEIATLTRDVGQYGIDLRDPEMMEGFLQNIANKIGSLIKGGTKVSVGGGKITVDTIPTQQTQQTTAAPTIQTSAVQPQLAQVISDKPLSQSTSISDLLNNKWVLLGLVGVPLLIMIFKSKRSDRENEK